MNADVYKGEQKAGILTRHIRHVEFAYGDSYSGESVGSTLPVRSDPYTAPAGQLPAFFVGLLPEGRRLTALRQLIKASADDELSLLLAVGGDTVGDVRVLPSGEEPHESVHVVEHRAWTDVDLDQLFRRSIDSVHDQVAIAGVQPKISGRMISFPAIGTSGPVIIKLDPPEYRHLVANENAVLDVAVEAGYPTPSRRLVQDRKGTDGLVIDRFDRIIAGDTVMRYPVEDGCQALDRYPADKYNIDTVDVITRLAELCAAPAVAALQLVERLVFSYLAGDGDFHARNMSVWRGPNDLWEPTPWYDIVCSAIYGDMTLAAPLNGDTNIREIGRRRLLGATDALDLPRRAVERSLDNLVPKVASAMSAALSKPPFVEFSNVTKVERTLSRRADLLLT